MNRSHEILGRLQQEAACDESLTDAEREILDDDLDNILGLIVRCFSYSEAEQSLLELGELHRVLATLAFRHGLQLSRRQRDIVREYDRWDIPEVRRCTYNKIRNEQYPWRALQGGE